MRHIADRGYVALPIISIHTLTKRATEDMDEEIERAVISIHALTKRATGSAGRVKWGGLYFNPRSHEESDIYL